MMSSTIWRNVGKTKTVPAGSTHHIEILSVLMEANDRTTVCFRIIPKWERKKPQSTENK